jgi:hypothetical protein
MANDDIIRRQRRRRHPPRRPGREFHPRLGSWRAERQQGRHRGAACASTRYLLRGLSERVRERVIRFAGQRATKDGVIVIEAGRFRTQERNRADAAFALSSWCAKAAEPPPPPRKKTKPRKGAVERRLKSKAGRSTVKKLRGGLATTRRITAAFRNVTSHRSVQMQSWRSRSTGMEAFQWECSISSRGVGKKLGIRRR